MTRRKIPRATARNICAYTGVGEMSTSLFFSCLTFKERIIATWLIVIHTITVSDKRINPCNVWEDSSQRDAFLRRLSRYTEHKHFHFANYSEAIHITEHWARKSTCYVVCLQTLLEPVYGNRADDIGAAYLRWHAASQGKKYQDELAIAACWEKCFCHGNAIRAYKQAYKETTDPEKRDYCLHAIAKIEHDMMTIN